jgi:anaerobic selenocysteine-containing dehydrogenase
MRNRRDIFKFAGGAVAGAFFTPAPWRLLTDTALWSENWPGIPRPASGEIRFKFTNCALCPAGCAVRARCVVDQPVSLAGVGGGLCPFGLTAHHLPYHPARLRQGPIQEATAAVTQSATQSVAQRAPNAVAVLDLNPGRTVSWTYRRAMASLKGLYLAPESHPVAYDLSAATTILSIGAPLLHGWGTPANVLAARPNFRLIQAEAGESRTAMLADEWIRIAPGTESAFAQSIPSLAYAKDISLVLGDAPEIPEINRQLGACGKTVFARPEAPVPESWIKNAAAVTDLAGVPDHSISLLLIDESSAVSYIPWHQIQRKLVRENPLVVTFAVTRGGYARYAQYALPTAVYPELLDDIAPAVDTVYPTFRISAPLVPSPAGVVNPADFVAALAGLSAATALRERADAIHHTAQGTVLTYADNKETPLKDLTADAFWKSLNDGARWDRPPGLSIPREVGHSSSGRPSSLVGHASACQPAADRPAPEPESPADFPLVAIREPYTPALVSPLMTKLYQESNLRLAPNRVALHPSDAHAANLTNGARAILQTRIGKCAVEVTVDPSVPPGAVQVGASPGIQDVCGPAARAKVVRA